MEKMAYLFLCLLSLAACTTTPNKITATDLLHHNFVLTHYDGKLIQKTGMQRRLEFGENLFVSASMCHTFSGFGDLNHNVLKVTSLSMGKNQYLNTCQEPLDHELDMVVRQMLLEGAHIQLNKNVLTLVSESHCLVYMLRDWVYEDHNLLQVFEFKSASAVENHAKWMQSRGMIWDDGCINDMTSKAPEKIVVNG